jgi:hypothetical protein
VQWLLLPWGRLLLLSRLLLLLLRGLHVVWSWHCPLCIT